MYESKLLLELNKTSTDLSFKYKKKLVSVLERDAQEKDFTSTFNQHLPSRLLELEF